MYFPYALINADAIHMKDRHVARVVRPQSKVLQNQHIALSVRSQNYNSARVVVTGTASSLTLALVLLLSVRGCHQGHDVAIDLFFRLALVCSEVSNILVLAGRLRVY